MGGHCWLGCHCYKVIYVQDFSEPVWVDTVVWAVIVIVIYVQDDSEPVWVTLLSGLSLLSSHLCTG